MECQSSERSIKKRSFVEKFAIFFIGIILLLAVSFLALVKYNKKTTNAEKEFKNQLRKLNDKVVYEDDKILFVEENFIHKPIEDFIGENGILAIRDYKNIVQLANTYSSQILYVMPFSFEFFLKDYETLDSITLTPLQNKTILVINENYHFIYPDKTALNLYVVRNFVSNQEAILTTRDFPKIRPYSVLIDDNDNISNLVVYLSNKNKLLIDKDNKTVYIINSENKVINSIPLKNYPFFKIDFDKKEGVLVNGVRTGQLADLVSANIYRKPGTLLRLDFASLSYGIDYPVVCSEKNVCGLYTDLKEGVNKIQIYSFFKKTETINLLASDETYNNYLAYSKDPKLKNVFFFNFIN
jgi:hypothetical protein